MTHSPQNREEQANAHSENVCTVREDSRDSDTLSLTHSVALSVLESTTSTSVMVDRPAARARQCAFLNSDARISRVASVTAQSTAEGEAQRRANRREERCRYVGGEH